MVEIYRGIHGLMNWSTLWQVLSWEPLRCHDLVDVGWHKLADLCIHEGKLLGCSFNQSCVGVWVVDLQVLIYGVQYFCVLLVLSKVFWTESLLVKRG